MDTRSQVYSSITLRGSCDDLHVAYNRFRLDRDSRGPSKDKLRMELNGLEHVEQTPWRFPQTDKW